VHAAPWRCPGGVISGAAQHVLNALDTGHRPLKVGAANGRPGRRKAVAHGPKCLELSNTAARPGLKIALSKFYQLINFATPSLVPPIPVGCPWTPPAPRHKPAHHEFPLSLIALLRRRAPCCSLLCVKARTLAPMATRRGLVVALARSPAGMPGFRSSAFMRHSALADLLTCPGAVPWPECSFVPHGPRAAGWCSVAWSLPALVVAPHLRIDTRPTSYFGLLLPCRPRPIAGVLSQTFLLSLALGMSCAGVLA